LLNRKHSARVLSVRVFEDGVTVGGMPSNRMLLFGPRPSPRAPLTSAALGCIITRNASSNFSQGGTMRARFLGKDPESQEGRSPTLFATDRTDRKT
jgi:hypothetical protein